MNCRTKLRGLYLAFFPTQPNYFKIGMSYDLYNRTRSNTYRTAFGKPPYFTFWVDDELKEGKEIKKIDIQDRISSSVRRTLSNPVENRLSSVEQTVLRAMKEKYVPGCCGVEVFERCGKNDTEIETDISEILKKNTIAYIKQRYRLE